MFRCMLAATAIAASALFTAVPAQATPPSSPALTVIDPGESPRTPLRYSYKVGQQSELVMRQVMDMTIVVDEQPLPSSPAPAILADMVCRIDTVEDDGQIATISFVIANARLDPDHNLGPAVAAYLEDALSAIRATGRMTIDSRGQVRDFSMEVPDDAPAQVRQFAESYERNLQSIVTPLPDEPVGRGAKWRTIAHHELNNVKSRNDATVELVSLEDGLLTLRTRVLVSAEKQQIESGDPDIEIWLLECSGEGNGEGTVRLDDATSGRMSMAVLMDQALETTIGDGAHSHIKQVLELKVSVEPKQ